MINTKLQSIIDTKSAIGNAIVNKGGTITSETPFFNYASEIDNISTGTPQTIFQASDGSKWALTNAVNLTNVSNNVTSDFNWWQPANNSTSDPILNVGTVGANISGNIRIVQVNQVNIAQYSNIVINDTTGAKYVGYNGYDSITNPTPTGNTTFNRWLLNNSASGTVIFANATIVNGGIYNGANASANISNIGLIGNTTDYGTFVYAVAVNNGSLYVGGGTTPNVVRRYHEGNLVISGNTTAYGGEIFDIKINNGSIFVGGDNSSNQVVRRYNESTLSITGNTVNFTTAIRALAINNNALFVGGDRSTIAKYNESTLSFISNSGTTGAVEANGLKTNNGFLYVTGGSTLQKFNESNLAYIANVSVSPNSVFTTAINNGFIYLSTHQGFQNARIRKYYESNFAFVAETGTFGRTIDSIVINSGFIYASGLETNVVRKYYESNLAIVANSSNIGTRGFDLALNNGFFYVGSLTTNRVGKFQEQEFTPDNQTFYNITTIKE